MSSEYQYGTLIADDLYREMLDRNMSVCGHRLIGQLCREGFVSRLADLFGVKTDGVWIRLRALRGDKDGLAYRSLKLFLKSALRAWGLRCEEIRDVSTNELVRRSEPTNEPVRVSAGRQADCESNGPKPKPLGSGADQKRAKLAASSVRLGAATDEAADDSARGGGSSDCDGSE